MTKPLPSFESILNLRLLRRRADSRSFARCEEYFNGDLVGRVTEHDAVISAKVEGTQTYRVKLWLEGDALDYSCSCPVGRDGEFCKHAVALGLAWLDGPHTNATTKPKSRKSVTLDDVRAQLLKRDKKTLVELIMQQAIEDDDLRRRLLMEVASRASDGLNLDTWREAVDEAVECREFVEYRDASTFIGGIDSVVDGIEALLKKGHASAVIELSEHALAAVERAIESVDDSDGDMGVLMERIQTLHHRACKKAKPDPELLARRLFAWELATEWDSFFDAATHYADVFGKKGLAVYRQLAEAEWAKVPTLRPGNRDSEKYAHRFRITQIMETLAKQSGDIETLVAVMQRDLSSQYKFLQIAEVYQAAKQKDQALDWAERGAKAFSGPMDGRLREFLADAYHARKRHAEAMALIWSAFCESMQLETYQGLLAHAQRSKQHELWRDRALATIRESLLAKPKKATAHRWNPRPSDRSLLVSIFLWEKNPTMAWAEALDGGCPQQLWLELAAGREQTHPQDALDIYQRQIEPTLDKTNDEAYRQVIAYLSKMRGLMARLDRAHEFVNLLGKLRANWKRKRNFIKMLDARRW
ncbi:MAG: DUF6880 family protein [Dokdonella sp.]